MSWLRNLYFCGAVFAIPTASGIAQEHTITALIESQGIPSMAWLSGRQWHPIPQFITSMFVNLAINIMILLDAMNCIARMGFMYQGQYCTHLI